jgi:hypothetical protein
MRWHRRYAYPLWWDLAVDAGDWALPLRVCVHPRLVDGSGRREHVARVMLSLFCLHWDVYYAWGRRKHRPAPERILSLREVMGRDPGEPGIFEPEPEGGD